MGKMESNKEMKTGILLTSRNNYEFMEKYWIPNFPVNDFAVLNIDEDSSPEQKDAGRKLCKKYGIEYLDREERGMQNNITTASNHFSSKGISWIIWFQHDCWPIQNDFMDRFDSLVDSGKLDQFGTIGFNVLATDLTKNYKKHIKQLSNGEKPFGITARCPLEGKRKWYSGTKSPHIPAINNSHLYKKPFAVEVPAWVAIAVNIDKYKKYIVPSNDYEFFHAWDDVAFQFLNNNVYNIALPDFYVAHRPDLKPDCGLPVSSVKVARNGDETFHGKWGHLEIWKKRWKWSWDDHKSYEKVRSIYKNTLLDVFYNHNPENGPVKIFDIG